MIKRTVTSYGRTQREAYELHMSLYPPRPLPVKKARKGRQLPDPDQ